MQRMTIGLALALAGAITAVNPSTAQEEQYEASSRGTRLLEGGNGFAIKMLVERSNLGGGEVEIGEITFPVGSGQSRRGHVHGTVEIFYVLSGELDHIVNDQSHILTPGM
ncbi:MAG: cupin domain-containing protein, partial [Phycisphaerales bacterium]